VTTGPWPLLALTVAVLAAGALCGCWEPIRRSLRFAVPLALTVCLINMIAVRSGFTVIWHFGNLPILGETNVTLQATVNGAVLGLKALALVLISTLYSVAIDPDEVLRLLRRFSFRSALTATVATRMVPVLVRDSMRLADAQRCRPGRPPSRVQLLRATTSGVLDRALDVAAALEVRGFGAARQPPRMAAGCSWGIGGRQRWSRHDFAFTAAALALVLAAVCDRVFALTRFASQTVLQAPLHAQGALACLALLAFALLPFCDRRGIVR
jgi:energy-coupling factor transport system permease protein